MGRSGSYAAARRRPSTRKSQSRRVRVVQSVSEHGPVPARSRAFVFCGVCCWLKRANVELRGAGLDESPDCYKRLPEVLAEHGDSIKILHTLTPVGVAMAGANDHDPYKD